MITQEQLLATPLHSLSYEADLHGASDTARGQRGGGGVAIHHSPFGPPINLPLSPLHTLAPPPPNRMTKGALPPPQPIPKLLHSAQRERVGGSAGLGGRRDGGRRTAQMHAPRTGSPDPSITPSRRSHGHPPPHQRGQLKRSVCARPGEGQRAPLGAPHVARAQALDPAAPLGHSD
jgi:hypothetical protein